MLSPTNPQSRPGSTAEDALESPETALVAAIIERAVLDALGKVGSRGCAHPGRTQHDARAWLDGPDAAELLALAGYEAEVVLRQVRRVLDG